MGGEGGGRLLRDGLEITGWELIPSTLLCFAPRVKTIQELAGRLCLMKSPPKARTYRALTCSWVMSL